MSEEVTIDTLAADLRGGFKRIDDRCADLSTAISEQGKKLDDVRLVQARQEERWTSHFQSHKRVDDRLEGLEDREREVTKTGIKLEKPSVPPRRNGNGRWTPERIKSYLMIGFFVMVGAMVAWNTVSSASKEDVEAVQERADSVAGAVEDKLAETRDVDEKVKKSYEELRKISQILGDVLGPETVVAAEPEALP